MNCPSCKKHNLEFLTSGIFECLTCGHEWKPEEPELKEIISTAVYENLVLAYEFWLLKNGIDTDLNACDLLRHYEGEVLPPEERFLFEMPNDCDFFLRCLSCCTSEAKHRNKAAPAPKKPEIKPIEARFHFDDFYDNPSYEKTFEGFTTGERWNGWQCPLFTKEQAIAFLVGDNWQHGFEGDKIWWFSENTGTDEKTYFEAKPYTLENGEVLELFDFGGNWVFSLIGKQEIKMIEAAKNER